MFHGSLASRGNSHATCTFLLQREGNSWPMYADVGPGFTDSLQEYIDGHCAKIPAECVLLKPRTMVSRARALTFAKRLWLRPLLLRYRSS